MQPLPEGSFRLTVLPFNEDLHWRSPVRPAPIYSGNFVHNGGGASSATHSPGSHGRTVEFDATLLGPRTSVTSGNVRSGGNFARPVSTPLLHDQASVDIVVVRLLPLSPPCIILAQLANIHKLSPHIRRHCYRSPPHPTTIIPLLPTRSQATTRRL